jgi:hypothetical protein
LTLDSINPQNQPRYTTLTKLVRHKPLSIYDILAKCILFVSFMSVESLLIYLLALSYNLGVTFGEAVLIRMCFFWLHESPATAVATSLLTLKKNKGL